ncbi:hypothetical protein [Haladaptatus cibarius]|uniref:hypothetical protein n=1 Tax=Haladaptatus cibarius TaxID=453847 RepID=UPI000ABD27F2|nr:hypothetical protein [Haladaptatus cibarius]
MNISWNSTLTAEYWQNGVIHELTIDTDGTITRTRQVEEEKFPDGVISKKSSNEHEAENIGVESGPVICTTDVSTQCSGGVSTDDPDWMDDRDLHHDPIQSCDTASWGQACTETTLIQPKYFTDCNGYGVPLVGAQFSGVSFSEGSQVGSISIGMWAGWNPTTNCLYWGGTENDECHKECFSAPPTDAELENRIKDDISDNFVQDVPVFLDAAWPLIKSAAIFVILFIITAIINIGTGGSVGA